MDMHAEAGPPQGSGFSRVWKEIVMRFIPEQRAVDDFLAGVETRYNGVGHPAPNPSW
jgi:hypothetical protein